MASVASPRSHHGRKGGQHHQAAHPLSSRRAGEHEGWAEGIASLTERHTATGLLEEAAPARAGGAKVRAAAGAM